jgi:hypothetical protein
VTFNATVTSSIGAAPDGEIVNFMQGSTVLGTAPLRGGIATFSDPTLPVGARYIRAVYTGDAKFATSTSKALSQVTSKATTTTTVLSAQNPSSFGQSATFTAIVAPQFSGTPAGSVTFYNGTVSIKWTPLVGGMASFTTTKLAAGTASITAVYSPAGPFLKSTSAPLSQVVNQASTTTTLVSSLNPSSAGQPVTFTATIVPQFGGTVTGTVTFQDGATTLGTVNVGGGAAKFTTKPLSSGTHNITATYNGTASFSTSSGSLTQTVN